MFEQKKFSIILSKIVDLYGSTVAFASSAQVGRSYLSKYINMKIPSPPTPKILEKIANASRGITNYDELMGICGYLNSNTSEQIISNKIFDDNLFLLDKYHLDNSDLEHLKKILINRNEKQANIVSQINNFAEQISISSFDENLTIVDLYNDLIKINENISNKLVNLRHSVLNSNTNYFEFTSEDDAMYPLLDIGDIALVYKQDYIEDGATLLINIDNHNTIRKFNLSEDKTYYILSAMNGYYKNIDLKITDINKIKVLGKVIKSENKSAFKYK